MDVSRPLYRLGLQICGAAMLMGFSIASAAWFFLDASPIIVAGIAAFFAVGALAGLALVWTSQRS